MNNKYTNNKYGDADFLRINSKGKLMNDLICEEFCYNGLKSAEIPKFPSTIFETKNYNYILAEGKK